MLVSTRVMIRLCGVHAIRTVVRNREVRVWDECSIKYKKRLLKERAALIDVLKHIWHTSRPLEVVLIACTPNNPIMLRVKTGTTSPRPSDAAAVPPYRPYTQTHRSLQNRLGHVDTSHVHGRPRPFRLLVGPLRDPTPCSTRRRQYLGNARDRSPSL